MHSSWFFQGRTYPFFLPISIVISTINDKKLAGVKFGKSTNKSIWRNKVWRIHELYMWYLQQEPQTCLLLVVISIHISTS